MNPLLTMIAICLWLTLSLPGCSKEEPPPPPAPKPKVVKPILRPVPEETVATPQPEVPSLASGATEAEGPEGVPADAIAEAQAENGVPAALPERAGVEALPESGLTEAEAPPQEEPGSYVAGKGETLESIAGREDVYGDPLKWVILYRYNRGSFDGWEPGPDFPAREPGEGLRLKVVTPEEIRKNLAERRGTLWVVNALSATSDEEIIPAAVSLIRNGYPVYLTRARVRETDWLRLRIGFYGSKAEADAAGLDIMNILDFSDFWTTQVGPQEFEQFAGY